MIEFMFRFDSATRKKVKSDKARVHKDIKIVRSLGRKKVKRSERFDGES